MMPLTTMSGEVRRWLCHLREALFPRACVACRARLGAAESCLCTTCYAQLNFTNFTPDASHPMARMFWGQFALSRCYAFAYYDKDTPLPKAIYRIKYGNDPHAARRMGRLIAQGLVHTPFFEDVDLLIPLPISRQRQQQRRYNQSFHIAQGLSDVCRLPVRADIVIRHRHKQPQTSVPALLRRANVADSFSVIQPASLKGKHVLLVDDVMTTGATLTSCAQVLEAAGASAVSIFTIGVSAKLPRPLIAEGGESDG